MKLSKKFFAVLLAVAMTLTISASVILPTSAVDIWDGSTVATAYAGGTGSEADPYQIATGAQLAFLATEAEFTASAGKFYKLTSDINLADMPWPMIGISKGLPFKGVFDGNGYTVSGLNCVTEVYDSSTYAGLFGYANAATIKNLTVTGSKVAAKYAGPIVGYAIGGTDIINCRTKVDWVDGVTIGGIVGRSQDDEGQILYCVSESTIRQTAAPGNADHFVGGIVGAAGNLTVSYCANKGDIVCEYNGEPTGKMYLVGGIIGVHGASSNPVDLKYCYNIGNITGWSGISTAEKSYAGGIVGRAAHVKGGSIIGCYNTGSVTWTTEKNGNVPADGKFGGLAGHIRYPDVAIADCYATAEVLVGNNEAVAAVDTCKTLTLAEMQGPDALKNMNLGSSVEAIIDATVATGVENANYREAVINAFTDYTEGKTLVEYVGAKVREKLNLTAGADIWVTAAGKTPELGSLEAIQMSSDIPVLTEEAVKEVLEGLYEQYKADPKYTTTSSDTDTDAPDITTETPTQIVVVGGTTTPAAGTTKAPADTDKAEEKSCGGFAAVAAVAAVVIASLSCAIVIKKH